MALVGQRPANLFWLGRDLARRSDSPCSRPTTGEQTFREIKQAVHHLHKVGVSVPTAERILLDAIRRLKNTAPFSEKEAKDFVDSLAEAKNEIGQSLQALQPGFVGYPTIEERLGLDRRIEKELV